MMPASAGKTQREFQLRQIMVNWRSKKCKAKGGISNSWHTTIAIILANALEASRIGGLTPEKYVDSSLGKALRFKSLFRD
jgi:hypothetical protein